jgi:ribosomal protein L11 methyltransferase
MSALVARLACDEATARSVATMVGENLPDGAASAAFEAADGTWAVEIYCRHDTDPETIRALVQTAGADAAALVFDSIAERDWIKASLDGLTPVRAGRFMVHGAHDRERIAVNAIAIEIEAALAFGTGHHGTTRGCLLALDRIAKRRKPRNTLDLGTGSGVLALAVAKACRTAVLASDIDAVAVAAARGNVRRNGLQAMVRAVRANGCGRDVIRSRAPYDLIFANILLDPLRRMAAPLAALVARGGHLVLSGLLPAHAVAVLAAYRSQGLMQERRLLLDGWVTVVLRRP